VYATLGDAVKIWSFGGEAPPDLPAWVTFHRRPSNDELATLYNGSAIFLVPSHYEGWGLPGAEAMACGAALVSTDNGGVRAYAKHEHNALLVPPQEPAALAAAIVRLSEHTALRRRLAEAGYRSIQAFTWRRALDAFEQLDIHP
jgi:glycosyltransferase involved in cell wall biosynthesis